MTDLPRSEDGQDAATGRQMCELISEYLHATTGREVAPMAIWNMSPTGELWPVFELYAEAKAWRDAR